MKKLEICDDFIDGAIVYLIYDGAFDNPTTWIWDRLPVPVTQFAAD